MAPKIHPRNGNQEQRQIVTGAKCDNDHFSILHPGFFKHGKYHIQVGCGSHQVTGRISRTRLAGQLVLVQLWTVERGELFGFPNPPERAVFREDPETYVRKFVIEAKKLM